MSVPSMHDFGEKTKRAYRTLVINRRFVDGQAPKRIAFDWGLPLWWVEHILKSARKLGDRPCRKRLI